MTTPDTDTRANWALRRQIGNALGLQPSPYYEWAWADANDNLHRYAAYETDLNAALTLLEQVSDEYTPRLVRILQPMGNRGIVYIWKCVIMSNLANADDEYEATAETPALAICRAWLAYTESQHPAPAGENGGA